MLMCHQSYLCCNAIYSKLSSCRDKIFLKWSRIWRRNIISFHITWRNQNSWPNRQHYCFQLYVSSFLQWYLEPRHLYVPVNMESLFFEIKVRLFIDDAIFNSITTITTNHILFWRYDQMVLLCVVYLLSHPYNPLNYRMFE